MPDTLAERVAGYLADANITQAPPPTPQADHAPLCVFYHRRFRCPKCKSDRFDSNRMRSRRQPDGVSRQVKTCSQCRYQFVLVVK
jgi:hypothetical protein